MNQHPIVITRLIGGLGNQMFQYAAGRAIAQHYNATLLLDVSGFENYDLRRYELGDFKIDARPAAKEELEQFSVGPDKTGILSRLFKKFNAATNPLIYKEPSFTYDPQVRSLKPSVYLDGYWQSEKYFHEVANLLREELTLRAPLDSANAEMAGQIRQAGEKAVSLHVRRGDYVSNAETAQYHGVCSLDYYRSAIAYVAERVQDPHFFIFSDDHEWVNANLHVGYDTTFVQVNGPDRGICDMTLMKSCSHHIIANSSFSWWGAWLNPLPGKIVIAPQQWFKQAGNDTRDLLPESWVKL
jgi:hypothetical protein